MRRATPTDTSASVGLACRAADEGIGTLARRADEALYKAKRTGRDRLVVADATM
jgi:PleD family two-component response regulator